MPSLFLLKYLYRLANYERELAGSPAEIIRKEFHMKQREILTNIQMRNMSGKGLANVAKTDVALHHNIV
ncbi:hypothetical protein ACNKHM_13960 [Shigella sonnei]